MSLREYEYMNVRVLYYMSSIWVYEYMSIWVYEYEYMNIYELWVEYEYMSIWVYEYEYWVYKLSVAHEIFKSILMKCLRKWVTFVHKFIILQIAIEIVF